MNEMQIEISNVMECYLSEWNLKRAGKVAEFYNVPSVFVTSDSVTLINSRDDILKELRAVLARLSSLDFVQSTWENKQVLVLDDGLSIASCTFKRHSSAADVIESGCATYTLRKTSLGWKVVTVFVHPAETQLRA